MQQSISPPKPSSKKERKRKPLKPILAYRVKVQNKEV
jgi:hypothetical protein